eukprot:1358963-Amphidinium_carterae.1
MVCLIIYVHVLLRLLVLGHKEGPDKMNPTKLYHDLSCASSFAAVRDKTSLCIANTSDKLEKTDLPSNRLAKLIHVSVVRKGNYPPHKPNTLQHAI